MTSAPHNVTGALAPNDSSGSSGKPLDNEGGFRQPDFVLFWRRLSKMQSWIQALQDSQNKDEEEQERLKHLCDTLEQKVRGDEEIRAMESYQAEQTRKRLEDELEREQRKVLMLEEELKIREMEASQEISRFPPRRAHTPDRYFRPRSQRYGYY